MTVRNGRRDTPKKARYRSNAGPKNEIIDGNEPGSGAGNTTPDPALAHIPFESAEGTSAVSHSSDSERDPSRIRAIETHYAGHRFRSRLEARWAVFFDTLGLRWHYEEEGYELPSGRYLPDFRLTNVTVYERLDVHVEVKGMLDRAGLIRLAQAARELPVPDRRVHGITLPKLLVLGEIPTPGWMGSSHLRIDAPNPQPADDSVGRLALQSIYFRKRPGSRGDGYVMWPIGEATPCSVALLRELTDTESAGVIDWFVTETRETELFSDMAVDNAYRAARSARFEFGESGA